ncbi:MAG TPA: hypothetical protein VE033_07045 [Acetobacteraceae bacterium]|jgi:hypothetical protein|nr:hypothetical protein [Acetobacteraceae bacterium]
MSIRGSVDQITTEGATGWAFPEAGGQLTVQAIYDGRIIGETLADQHRHDLAEAGFGDGRCGFQIAFYEEVDPSLLPFVSIRPRGGDVELPRYAMTGFADFFRSIHARHPGAGRHRSVLGGLWIDRTDARAMLAGRVATGSTAGDLAAALGMLIADGYVVLRNALAANGLSGRGEELVARLQHGQAVAPEGEGRDALEAIAELVFRDIVLRPVRAALDDQPVCTRIVPVRGAEHGFMQPSTAEALPSPAECLVLVAAIGGGLTLDVVRGSHALPEFTGEGRSRWTQAGIGAAQELALAGGLSVEQSEIGSGDIAILGAGTLHRIRAAEGTTGLRAWVLPRRVTPTRFLTGEAGTFSLRHATGAMLAA